MLTRRRFHRETMTSDSHGCQSVVARIWLPFLLGKRPIKTYPLIASILYCIDASYSCSLIRADVEIILKDGQELLSIEYLQ